ncbi:hypothetical protein [Kitasatospora sp. NBC_01300]|uniref:hypothetical protein n=1 Tax=Kitasatospora sp. NBC_01300 TaxID=2903574 RepID=UPI002F915C06|nr:hypothetical protein OG556_40740 [Kitasatospora sp. NBC_01300]
MHPTTQLTQRPAYLTAVGGTGVSLSAGAQWLLHGQPDLVSRVAAWRELHGLAPIRIMPGPGWEAIAVHRVLGEPALRRLGRPGPVLFTGGSIVYFVPALTHPWGAVLNGIARKTPELWDWGKSLTVHLPADGTHEIHCPRPGIPHRKVPYWLAEPDGTDRLTFAGELATALDAVSETALAPLLAEKAHKRETAPSAPQTPTERSRNNVAAFFGRRPHSTEAT